MIIMKSGKILLGLLAGVAIGATLGILFAPDKGSSTRKKISKKGDEYADELEKKFNDFIDSMTKKYETVKDEANNLAETGMQE
jgi:gas vesicle protein